MRRTGLLNFGALALLAVWAPSVQATPYDCADLAAHLKIELSVTNGKQYVGEGSNVWNILEDKNGNPIAFGSNYDWQVAGCAGNTTAQNYLDVRAYYPSGYAANAPACSAGCVSSGGPAKADQVCVTPSGASHNNANWSGTVPSGTGCKGGGKNGGHTDPGNGDHFNVGETITIGVWTCCQQCPTLTVITITSGCQ